MKKVFIPKGETVVYDELNTGVIVVKGTLKVTGKLTASFIQGGGGRVEAEEIQCDTIEVGTVQAEILTARKVVGKKLFIRDCIATDAVMATDFIESLHVLTKFLYISLSSISQCDAEEIIMLSQKKRGLLRMLFVSKMRSMWVSTFHSKRAAPAGESRRHKKNNEVLCRDTEIDLVEPEDIYNEGASQTVAEIMKYLDENGYIKKPNINVEYRGTEASFRTDCSAKEGAGSACEEVA